MCLEKSVCGKYKKILMSKELLIRLKIKKLAKVMLFLKKEADIVFSYLSHFLFQHIKTQ